MLLFVEIFGKVARFYQLWGIYARFDGQLFVTHSFMNSTDVQKFKQIIEKWSFYSHNYTESHTENHGVHHFFVTKNSRSPEVSQIETV